jgi:hypothetical protein
MSILTGSATLFLINLLGVSAIWGLLTSIRESCPFVFVPMLIGSLHAPYSPRIQICRGRPRESDESPRQAYRSNERDFAGYPDAQVKVLVSRKVRKLTSRFMAWERSFQKRVNDIRKDELHWQARNYQIEVGFNCLYEITPILVTVVAFLVSSYNEFSFGEIAESV